MAGLARPWPRLAGCWQAAALEGASRPEQKQRGANSVRIWILGFLIMHHSAVDAKSTKEAATTTSGPQRLPRVGTGLP
jgi:hypothetical protein